MQQQYKTCITTAMDPNLLGIVDRRLGLSALFGGRVVTLADVGFRAKPNPDLFLHAAKLLAVEPRHCVVIEDAPHSLEAARRAGMHCVGLTTTYERALLQAADRVVDGFIDLDVEEFDRLTG